MKKVSSASHPRSVTILTVILCLVLQGVASLTPALPGLQGTSEVSADTLNLEGRGLAQTMSTTVPSLASSRQTVLALDVTGSMNDSDALCYGPSTVNLLADLAGSSPITVFTFAGTGPTGVKLLGTFKPADPGQLQGLRQKVAEIDAVCRAKKYEGATPTAELVAAILQHFQATNAPAGSTAIIVSDGFPEPDAAGQYARIFNDLLPQFAQRQWRVDTIALGSGDWLTEYFKIASTLGGISASTNNASELISLAVRAMAANKNDPAPVVTPVQIGTDGHASVPIEMDPTMKQLTVVVTRETDSTKATLVAPDGRVVKQSDAGVVAWNEDDQHYSLMAIKGSKPLGAGRWTVELQGRSGESAYVAVVKRSSLQLAIVEPKGGLFLAGRKGRVCAQLSDADTGLSVQGASVRATAMQIGGAQVTAELRDDGRDDSGDVAANDGVYCGRLTLPQGQYRLSVVASTPGSGAAEAQGSLLAQLLPGFDLLRQTEVPTLRDGETLSAHLAELTWVGGKVDPSIVTGLELIVQLPNGRARRVELDPRNALDPTGLLTVGFPVTLQDVTSAIVPTPKQDGGVQISYPLVVRATYMYRGQTLMDDAAISTQLAVRVRPWPWPVGMLPSFMRPWVAMPLESEPIRFAAVGLVGLATILVALRVVLPRLYNLSSGYEGDD